MKKNKEIEKLMAIHNLVKSLMETKNYDGVKLLGKVLIDSDIPTKKTYMVATKSIKDKLGEERSNLVYRYYEDMLAKGYNPV